MTLQMQKLVDQLETELVKTEVAIVGLTLLLIELTPPPRRGRPRKV